MLDILCTTLFPNFYPIHFKDSSYYMYLQVVENSVDPDQLASEKPADQDLHCFQNRLYLGSAWLRVSVLILF